MGHYHFQSLHHLGSQIHIHFILTLAIGFSLGIGDLAVRDSFVCSLTDLENLSNAITSHGKAYDPMVSFVCNKGAMHMDPDLGWHSDSNTDCLGDKAQILNYCKSMYPSLEVTNIVETADHMVIKGWCPIGDGACERPDTFKVQPYRCLIGSFQSDALIVPRDCVFDHVHDIKVCERFSHWEAVASAHCSTKRNMDLTHSVAMLMPCGTDVFSGVEFVCCPENTPRSEIATPSVPLDAPKISIKVSVSQKNTSTTPDAAAIIDKYIHLQPSAGQYDNEHAMYELAKKQLTSINHDKVTKLTKEWSEARERMTRLRMSDPQQAEKHNAEISGRYQKEYFALEMEEEAKVLQLDALHQQHVQLNVNMEKKHHMMTLMDELQSPHYDVEKITKALKRYISAEQKDAHHCLQHYIKIKTRDAESAQEMLPVTIEHLTLINTRINQSIELLDTLQDKDVVGEMKENTWNWMEASYVDLAKSVAELELLSRSPQADEDDSSQDSAHDSDSPINMYKTYAEQFYKTDLVKKPDMQEDTVDSLSRAKLLPKASSMTQSEVNAEVQGLTKSGASNTMSAGATIAIAFGVIAAMMVVVFAILIVKKKGHMTKRRFTNTYLEVSVDSELSPEDRHIAAMQNGYENPTYMLLEERKV